MQNKHNVTAVNITLYNIYELNVLLNKISMLINENFI